VAELNDRYESASASSCHWIVLRSLIQLCKRVGVSQTGADALKRSQPSDSAVRKTSSETERQPRSARLA